MIENVHVDPKLEKCLAVLRRGSRRACLAADRTEAIIETLKRGKKPAENICTFTRNGEGRIKGCRKYDLGAGYRLVTLKQEKNLFLLFAGTHDECCRWIENNRAHLALESITERCNTIKLSGRKKEKSTASPSSARHVDADEDCIAPLSDKDLRMVFSGLVEGN